MDKSLSVLVVDDDILIRNVVEEVLSDGGFEAKAASSGEEAIALLNAHRYCAVIIDIAFGKDHVRGGQWPDGPGRSMRPCPSSISPAVTLTSGRFRVCRTAWL